MEGDNVRYSYSIFLDSKDEFFEAEMVVCDEDVNKGCSKIKRK